MRIPIKTGLVDIPADGATDRTQLTNIECSSVTIQAPSTNSDPIYVGGSDVTNISGANPGIILSPGSSISNITVENLNHVFVAADTAGDDAKFLIT